MQDFIEPSYDEDSVSNSFSYMSEDTSLANQLSFSIEDDYQDLDDDYPPEGPEADEEEWDRFVQQEQDRPLP